MWPQAFKAGLSGWAGVFGAVTKYDHLATLALIIEMELQIRKYEQVRWRRPPHPLFHV
jgi:hypothetical protein